ncbi:unnamed protein product [Dovyalis caffra]|uniref:Uncharacterized protein n=1 Tax=Dovyalis caffra TaxID=77055 RepID=A0AAV1QT89_9ROSI|nr:unnamed protein product [Dovyalis caffra]
MQPPPLKAEGRQCPRLFQREGREGFNPAIGFLTATLFRTKAPLGRGGVSQRSSAHSGRLHPRHHKKRVFGDLMCGFEKVQVLSAPRTILATETHTSTILVAVFLEKKVALAKALRISFRRRSGSESLLFGTLGSAGPHGAGEPSVPNQSVGPVDPCRIFGAEGFRLVVGQVVFALLTLISNQLTQVLYKVKE